MIHSPPRASQVSDSAAAVPPTGQADRVVKPPSPYGGPFWKAYVANSLVMVAIALLYRYADFVTLLGGSELHLGWIVGTGMVGSLLMRLLLGRAIDHHGARLIWLVSLVTFSLASFAHLGIGNYNGPAIYLVRIVWCSSIAGIFGASVTFISGRAPVARMAEMIGMWGTSGFVGMVLGTQLGDWLCGTPSLARWQVDRMFLVAGSLGLGAVLFARLATRGLARPPRRRRPPVAWLLRRYQPGTVLVVGVAMGIGLALPGTFLRTYAAELDIARIGTFFAVFAPTAITTRLLTRRLPERLGLSVMILTGLGMLAVGQLLFLLVRSQWQLVVPGIGYGVAHALLFPSVIAAGTRTFPNRYRGLGTMLIWATYDAGVLIGAPTAGAIVHFSGLLGLPSYPIMFVFMAGLMTLIGVLYGLTCRKGRPQRKRRGRETRAERVAGTRRVPSAGCSKRNKTVNGGVGRPAPSA